MTVKQIAEIAQVGEETVRRAITKRFPGLLKNGVPADLVEFQAILVMGDLRKKGFVAPQNEKVAPQNGEVQKLQLPSGAQMRALESIFGTAEAGKRIDFAMGYQTSKDRTAALIGHRVLAKQERERQQLKLPGSEP